MARVRSLRSCFLGHVSLWLAALGLAVPVDAQTRQLQPGLNRRLDELMRQGQPQTPGAGTGLPLFPASGMLPIGGGLPIQLPGMTTGQLGPAVDLRRQEPRPEQRWPSWVEIGGEGRRGLSGAERAEASRDPERLLLIRYSDLVLVRPSDEKAFFPLHFWDKLRVLDPGSGVRIDGGGRANLLFSDGCRIDALHEFELWFSAGKAESLELDLVWVSRAELQLGARETRVWLPDGSELLASRARFSIERSRRDAPWMQGGAEDRIEIRNWGPGPLRLRLAPLPGPAARGVPKELDLAPGRLAVLPVVGGRRSLRAAELAERFEQSSEKQLPRSRAGGGTPVYSDVHAAIREQGATLDVRTELQPSRLRWGGVEFQVPGGRSLRIDPIGGRPFAPEEPTEKKPTEKEARHAGRSEALMRRAGRGFRLPTDHRVLLSKANRADSVRTPRALLT